MQSNRGLCRVLAAIAQNIGISVSTVAGDVNSNVYMEENLRSLSCFVEQSCEEKAQKLEFDCIVCSNDLRSAENGILNKILTEGNDFSKFHLMMCLHRQE